MAIMVTGAVNLGDGVLAVSSGRLGKMEVHVRVVHEIDHEDPAAYDLSFSVRG